MFWCAALRAIAIMMFSAATAAAAALIPFSLTWFLQARVFAQHKLLQQFVDCHFHELALKLWMHFPNHIVIVLQ